MFFISYSRKDITKTLSIIKDIEDLGDSVWFDKELSAGRTWWDEILENIRKSEVFIFILSDNSLISNVCKSEYTYASQLGKPILPILIDDHKNFDNLPPALATIQIISYKTNERESLIKLAKSIKQLKQLAINIPNSLPTPPAPPLSPFGSIKDRIQSVNYLSYEEQCNLIFDLKKFSMENNVNNEIIELIRDFKKRKDLSLIINSELDSLYENQSRIGLHTINIIDLKSKPEKIIYIVLAGMVTGSIISGLVGIIVIKPSAYPIFAAIGAGIGILLSISALLAKEKIKRLVFIAIISSLIGASLLGSYPSAIAEGVAGAFTGLFIGLFVEFLLRKIQRINDQQVARRRTR